jgi:hypothetical protein
MQVTSSVYSFFRKALFKDSDLSLGWHDKRE